MSMEWRPVNRYSGNAKKHAPKREPKRDKVDFEASVKEAFDKWKNTKGKRDD